MILTCKKSNNFKYINAKKEDLVQFQFAEIINQKHKATILNYGFLDGGFYTVTGITPNVKYFQNQNISHDEYPIIMDEQQRYIKEKMMDFVILKLLNTDESLTIPYLYENYDKIESRYVEEVNCHYMLFKLKDN